MTLPDSPKQKKQTLSAGVGVAPKTFHRRCTVRRHATTTPERMPARGLARRDWREFNERKDWSGWPSGRGWPGIPGQGSARRAGLHGEGSGWRPARCGEVKRAAEGRPERLATAPRNKPARADGATSALGDSAHTAIAQPSPKSRCRDGSGLCIPTLRLLAQTAPPRAPEIPLPAPAIPLAVRKGYYLSVTLNMRYVHFDDKC